MEFHVKFEKNAGFPHRTDGYFVGHCGTQSVHASGYLVDYRGTHAYDRQTAVLVVLLVPIPQHLQAIVLSAIVAPATATAKDSGDAKRFIAYAPNLPSPFSAYSIRNVVIYPLR